MKNDAKYREYMAALCEIHGKEPLTSITFDIYWKALEPFDDDQCETAFKDVLLHSKFFPKPADLLERLEGRKQDQATLAWLKVLGTIKRVGTYQSVRFDDPVIHSVIQAMGGWIRMGEITNDEMPWKQREFERIYAVIDRPGSKHLEYLPGRTEMDNFSNGYFDHMPKPISIGKSAKNVLQIEEKANV